MVVLEQVGHVLERRVRSQRVDRVAGQSESAGGSVDLAEASPCRDDPFEPRLRGSTDCHRSKMRVRSCIVNVDSTVNMTRHLTAKDAARRLGVSRATLYAYVSRGLVRSRPTPDARAREYDADDIAALLARRRARRDPGAAAAEALGFQGLPVLPSQLSHIDQGRLLYRGHDAIALSEAATLEEVAALLWDGPFELDASAVDVASHIDDDSKELPALARCITWLTAVGSDDPMGFNLAPTSVRKVGARIVSGLAGLMAGHPPTSSVSETLVAGWRPRNARARRRIEGALVLCADHELNVSAFTARCVASAGATAYMAVVAALAAMQGHRHGGQSELVAAMLDEPGSPREVIARRLRRGEPIVGFGHPLYPEGDPRAGRLLELSVSHPTRRRARGFVRAAKEVVGEDPNLDFGLVALARSLELPADAPLCLFALGRTVGYIAHALEQYDSGQLIRPRALYTGPRP